MNTFLKEVKKVYDNVVDKPDYYASLRVILGNEACDLDSAVSALVYGYLLHHEGIEDNLQKTAVLPLLNISQNDLPLKTEVTYFLEANDIPISLIPTRGFRNLLDLKTVNESGSLKLNLVDYHVLPPDDEDLRESVESVIDHRPQDLKWPWENIKELSIKPVGSCCTLVAEKIMKTSSHLLTEEIAKLLLGPIILDTVNLSEKAGRATKTDEEVVQRLEEIVNIDRDQLLNDLLKAKANIKPLTNMQVFRKDLKIVEGVPVAGAPILIEELCRRENFEKDLVEFQRLNNNTPVVILMGVFAEGLVFKRDLAIFSPNAAVGDAIFKTFCDSTIPLNLEEVPEHGIPGMRLFQQNNVKVTRKHLVPIISKVAVDIINSL